MLTPPEEGVCVYVFINYKSLLHSSCLPTPLSALACELAVFTEQVGEERNLI